jgi:nucleotide-binding universal stress UspA family protein
MNATEELRRKSERQRRFCTGLHPKKILACVDLEEDTDEFVRCVLEFAEMVGATVDVLHVVEPAPFMSGMESVPLVLSDKEQAEGTYAELLTIIDRENRYHVRVAPLVRKGKPFHEISSAAKEVEADLIVIPARPPVHFRRWHHTTAEKVVQMADCPVLVMQ